MILSQDISRKLQKSKELLKEIEKVESKFFEYGDIGARNKAILNLKKLNALRIQENYQDFEKLSKETFELALSCYFDQLIDQILVSLLTFIRLPTKDFQKLLLYLKQSENKISDELAKVLIFQFNIRNKLLKEGKKFFIEIHKQRYIGIFKRRYPICIYDSNYDERIL